MPEKAHAVEAITAGLRMGAAHRKVATAAGETPFPIRRRATGKMAQSHSGKKIPRVQAAGIPAKRPTGRKRSIRSCVSQRSANTDRSDPSSTNGMDSRHKERKTMAASPRNSFMVGTISIS